MDRRTHPGKEDKPIGASLGDSETASAKRYVIDYSHICYH